MALSLGSTLGHYEIQSLIGSGGMGEVYLGLDSQLGRKVAIKVLPDKLLADKNAQTRMLREARAAATLDHPNICAIYEVGEGTGCKFIAMQFVEGETLDEAMERQLNLGQILQIAVQLADALTEAHSKGIIHRDIKPPNIMITPRGEAKIMDFGLAKIEAQERVVHSEVETAALLSAPGLIIGTLPSMSPEQVRGKPVDARTDLFSLGVVLYEMVSGRRPFQGDSSAEISSAIFTYEPPPLARYVDDIPPELQRIVDKLLHKDPDDRYQTARDLLIDLRTLRDEIEFQHRLERSGSSDSFNKPLRSIDRKADPITEVLPVQTAGEAIKHTAESPARPATAGTAARSVAKILPFALACIVLAAAAGWWLWHRSNVNWAKGQMPRVAELAKSGDFFGAYDLASEVQKYIPADPTLSQLMPTISDTLSVTSEPAGASVYLKRFTPGDAGRSQERRLIGTTPMSSMRIARGQYILYIEKEGFAGAEQTLSGAILHSGGLTVTPPPIEIRQRLFESGGMPDKMVFVPGGDYRLVAWERPTDDKVRLDDFFIDKYEVSNQDFKDFINAGGYLKKQFWNFQFVKDGKTLSWEDAMKEFKDHTGLPGPRSWSNQNFPDGKGEYPVTDISWYEAAAYAAYKGKQLPTIFQWEKAARNGQVHALGTYMPWGLFYPGDTMENRSNFDNNGTTPVSAMEFGMSPFGAYNMAGNVSEWTANDTSEGYIATGGSWGDPSYTFAQYGKFPGFYSSPKRGFRCVLNSPNATGDQGGAWIEIKDEIPVYKPSSDADFAKWVESYRYDKTPLDPQIVGVQETNEWRREKITFNGAAGQRAIAYLYLPKNFPRPLQAVTYIPGGDVERGLRPLPVAIEDRLAALIKSGRAVFGVVTEGYVERLRPASFVYPDRTTAEYREMIVNRITDIRRGLDYLETRDDIDPKRIAFFAPSAGARIGLILAAVEDRFACVFLQGAGVVKEDLSTIPEANPINFAPHIHGPKLMMHGRYDEDTPLTTQGEPLFKLLREPKQLVLFEGGHVPPAEVQVPLINKWFDQNLGPVKNE
jgi:serine/threonine protein kinase/formylglycine-generating enzyme required for sulfatase activity/pimeloyl-ACP methyl ester carboxylesterase